LRHVVRADENGEDEQGGRAHGAKRRHAPESSAAVGPPLVLGTG
jgi:hypothetical protein